MKGKITRGNKRKTVHIIDGLRLWVYEKTCQVEEEVVDADHSYF